jgi:zinc transport system permease protein
MVRPPGTPTGLIAITIMVEPLGDAIPKFFDALSSSPLIRNAVIAGGLCGACCASLSPLVVLRRMAFVGDGMAHAAFGGIGLAMILIPASTYDDNSVRAVTVLYCLLLGAAIGKASRRGDASNIAEDSAIGIAFSASVALGALLLKLRQKMDGSYATSVDTYLFGSLINVGAADVVILGALTVAVALILLFFYKEIFFYAFDSRLAEVSGVNARFIHYLFILLLVLTVVVSSRVVGIILVSASLILPGVIALRLCAQLFSAMIAAALIGLVSFLFGMFCSYWLDVNPGSAIVLIQFVWLIIVSLVKMLLPKKAEGAPKTN